jgi:threonyl-tRNA synthetase
MVHRAILGSLERFIGALIEHYAGAFPVWLAPIQVAIIPVSDRHAAYAEKVKKELLQIEARVEVDARRETMGSKIRDAQLQKVPYMLIVGDKEEGSASVAVRSREKGDLGAKKLSDFLFDLKQEISYNNAGG